VTILPPLVGLIGKKRVGKDTFAAVLVEEFGFARVAFADPLKEMALTIDPWIHGFSGTHRLATAVRVHGWESAKDRHPDVRYFLQRLGDGVRQFDPEFWVRVGMAQADLLRHDRPMGSMGIPAKPVVITDVRYPNEADAVREAGGILVRIMRPGVDDGDTHASETALDDYEVDAIVENDGDLADLRELAHDVMEDIRLERLA
jgi:hypothetical protein